MLEYMRDSVWWLECCKWWRKEGRGTVGEVKAEWRVNSWIEDMAVQLLGLHLCRDVCI